MPQYDVHLYKLYRVKHAGVDASSMEEAITKAIKLPDKEAECIEDCEEPAYEALVDVVGDEEYEQTLRFEMIDEKPVRIDASAHLAARERALKLCQQLAAFTKDGDFVDGEEYYADGNDEEIDALYGFIDDARGILGLPEIAGEEG